MVATRVQKAQHVIRTVFDFGQNSNLEKAMEEGGLMDVLQWLTVNDLTLSALTYKDAAGNDTPLRLGDWHKIRVYRAMVEYKRLNGQPQSYDGTDSTQQEFDEFMGSSICIRLMISSQATTTNPAAPNVMVSTVQAELQAFRKGIKRDAGLYPVMTQDTQWDTWNRSVVSIARAQAIEQVLDSTYQTVLPDEVALFAEKQKYFYAILE
jgi:hypothetical protein